MSYCEAGTDNRRKTKMRVGVWGHVWSVGRAQLPATYWNQDKLSGLESSNCTIKHLYIPATLAAGLPLAMLHILTYQPTRVTTLIGCSSH
ncbi:hypothetical protein GDO81_015903 [Engystomops pustulosus]|uniref:Uncharacterized protein n=1 Tax=Engystomops pustulosus TaxID=76066 RepID=A0AAV7ASP8_ENGPU|nr:hypothetical protein GDO81_015903 [Engystomops pustulosus]